MHELELIDVLHVIRRRWLIIVLVVMGCLAGSTVATVRAHKTYRASIRIIFSGASGVSPIDEISRRQLANQRAVAFSQIAATGPAVRAATAAAVASNGPFSTPGNPGVTAAASGDDPFLDITVTDRDPRKTAAVANAYVTVLAKVVNDLEQTPTAVPETLSAVDPAAVPSQPFTPRPVRNGLIGLIAGIVLGLASAFVRDALDGRLRDSDEVEKATGVTALGVVPDESLGTHLPVETHPLSSRAEAYRKVRTNLTFASDHGVPRSILVTSSTSGEGKTTLATNLALACARTGQRVALVDADLRRPMVAEYMGVEAEIGLTSVLTGRALLRDVKISIRETGVDIVASGPIPANPSELLGSAWMEDIIKELTDDYDVVIFDAPPVLPVADALVLLGLIEAVVLVAKVGNTTRDRLRRAKDAVLKVGGNLVGVVPNAVIQREDSAYAYAYRYKSRGDDTLSLYTKKARRPELAEDGTPLDLNKK